MTYHPITRRRLPYSRYTKLEVLILFSPTIAFAALLLVYFVLDA